MRKRWKFILGIVDGANSEEGVIDKAGQVACCARWDSGRTWGAEAAGECYMLLMREFMK